MTGPIYYTLYKDGEEHNITITPVNQVIPGGDLYVTGVFRLNEGEVGMGELVFDDNMNQWEYTGMGDLNHRDASEIAEFIKTVDKQNRNNNNPA